MKVLILDKNVDLTIGLFIDLDFVIRIDGEHLRYMKCPDGYYFTEGENYPSGRVATHLLHINDWYAKQRDL